MNYFSLKKWISTILFFCWISYSQGQCVGNLLQNGSFTGSKGTNVTAPGWVASNIFGNSPDLNDAVGPLHSSPTYNWTCTPVPSSDGGTWQSLCSPIEAVEQTISLTQGQSYTLKFEYAAQGVASSTYGYSYSDPVGVSVYINGVLVYTTPIDNTQCSWETACFIFVASSPVITMRLTPSTGQYLGIDGACLLPTTTGSPIDLGNDTALCQGDSLILDATALNASTAQYLWQDGSTNSTFNVTQQGIYWVKVINNCNVSTDTINVDYNPLPVIDIGMNTTICQGETKNLDGTTLNATYLWQDNSTAPTFAATQQGDYWVKVTVNNCSSSDSISIDYDKPVSIIITNPLCHLSNDGAIVITLIKNRVIASSIWTPSSTNSIINDSTVKATGLIGGTYNCHVTSVSGCSIDTSIVLVAPPALLDSIKSTHARCPTDANGSASVYAYGGTGSYTYSWNTNPVQTSSSASSLMIGEYVVTISDSNSCIKKDSVAVSSNPFPLAGFTAQSVCFGDTTHFINTSYISTGTFSSLWLFGVNGDSSASTTANYLYPSCNNYTAKLTVTSDSGCVDTISHTIFIFCKPSATFTIADTVGCEPLCVTLQNTPQVPSNVNVQWEWTLGDGGATSSSQNFEHCYNNDSAFAPISYTVSLTVTSDSGCVSTVTKNNYITVYPNPVANFIVDPETTLITNPVISVSNLSTGTDFVNWNFSDNSFSSLFTPLPHMYSDTGTYIIKLITTTQYGCIDSSIKTIAIEPDFVCYIPNAFTPNGDGINDTFFAEGIFIQKYEMTIFDRWGNLIFSSDDINKSWNGKVSGSGEMVQRDSYVYVIGITDIKNRKHNYKGAVTVVR